MREINNNKIALKKKLKNGNVVFGPWCVIPSCSVMNIIATAGFDYVIIDLEHGTFSFETAEEVVRTAQSENTSPIIRLGQINEEYILKTLDIGTEGLLVAHVETSSDAKDVVNFSKYYPIGKRGFSPYTRAGRYSGGDITKHTQKQNDDTFIGVILEGKKGIDNIDSILETEHLDIVYIGAYDLSQALGIPGDIKNPLIKNTMEKLIKKIRDANIAPGGYVARNKSDINWMIDIGMQFITYLPDCAAISEKMLEAVDDFKNVLHTKGEKL